MKGSYNRFDRVVKSGRGVVSKTTELKSRSLTDSELDREGKRERETQTTKKWG